MHVSVAYCAVEYFAVCASIQCNWLLSVADCAHWRCVEEGMCEAACKHLHSMEVGTYTQYIAELQKKEYSVEEREERKQRGHKRPATDALVSEKDEAEKQDAKVGV
jgi:Na+-translocating ferredoxin:NAD+ oxidoreductase RnfC subunit